MSVREDQIVRELNRYIHLYPEDQKTLAPVYDAALDHSRRRGCTHNQRCPLVMAAAAVADKQDRLLCLRHAGGFALAEAEPGARDNSLVEAGLRLLTEEVSLRDVWTQPADDGPFLIDVTPPRRHTYGQRLRVGFRYLFRAHSGAVLPPAIEMGAAAWVPLASIDIAPLHHRLERLLLDVWSG
ncbi:MULTISPECIES: NUDIX hydrolase [Streptomyces]|uniref:NUDIX hydrolase n=1 Tax=Streptomyces TaxID=1883 RepID=UPI00163C0929|nr:MULTISPECIES: NUDIX hydrolase [Streptomyces]MBC2876219.1 NUDIX hydrolase [Streptomyces sp. TYQ1024]UBI35556.1 NUDIX hydrolase [Streptomyces mobaraensis]UKW28150.1 NUDIX hydrolase [Streptomyces sp. TYQ1024]